MTQAEKPALTETEITSLIGTVTHTNSAPWKFKINPYTYITTLQWDIEAPNFDFMAALHGLRSVATMDQIKPSFFKTMRPDQTIKISLTKEFSLQQQWAGDPQTEREFLRILVTAHQNPNRYHADMIVQCDQWGNALRNHQGEILQAVQTYHADHTAEQVIWPITALEHL